MTQGWLTKQRKSKKYLKNYFAIILSLLSSQLGRWHATVMPHPLCMSLTSLGRRIMAMELRSMCLSNNDQLIYCILGICIHVKEETHIFLYFSIEKWAECFMLQGLLKTLEWYRAIKHWYELIQRKWKKTHQHWQKGRPGSTMMYSSDSVYPFFALLFLSSRVV